MRHVLRWQYLWITALTAGALVVFAPSVAGGVESPDIWITAKVAAALLLHESVDDAAIHVDTDDGRVTLYGWAATAADKQRGVRCVATLIETSDQDVAAEQARESCDGEPNLAQDVYITAVSKLRLLANGATSAFDIGVATEDGVVKVTGVVPSAVARAAAEMEIRRVRWVRRVENQLRVDAAEAWTPSAVSDARDAARAAG